MTNNKKKVVLILGAFDGFHNGHLNLINKAKNKYKNYKIYITIFDFNNANFQKKETQYCQYPIKAKQAKILNIDKVIKVNFRTIFNLDGLIWIKKIINNYNPHIIMAGKDFAFGKDKKYNTTDLLKIFDKVELFNWRKKNVSTSLLIKLVVENKFNMIKKLSPFYFSIETRIKNGKLIWPKNIIEPNLENKKIIIRINNKEFIELEKLKKLENQKIFIEFIK